MTSPLDSIEPGVPLAIPRLGLNSEHLGGKRFNGLIRRLINIVIECLDYLKLTSFWRNVRILVLDLCWF